jgi:hypothetical protein
MHAIHKFIYQDMPISSTFFIEVVLVRKFFFLTLSNAVHNLPGHLEASGQARRK